MSNANVGKREDIVALLVRSYISGVKRHLKPRYRLINNEWELVKNTCDCRDHRLWR